MDEQGTVHALAGVSILMRLLVVAAMFLAGCASVDAPASKWQTLANQATAALKVGPVYIDERPNSKKGFYICREMRIELGTATAPVNTRMLLDTRMLLAHELGHHVLRHCAESPAMEMAAHELAVTILEIWGDTPAQAQNTVARNLYAVRGNTTSSIHDYCAELKEFLRRFPAAVDPRAPGQCS